MTTQPLPYSPHTGPPAAVVNDLTVDRGPVRALDADHPLRPAVTPVVR